MSDIIVTVNPPNTTSAIIQTYPNLSIQTDQFIGDYLTRGESGLFYPASNPNGFISSAGSGGIVTGSVVRPSDTGNFITIYQTGNFYPTSNPSGFLTSIDVSGLGLTVSTADARYFQLSQSGQFASNINLINSGSNLQSQIINLSGYDAGTYYLKSNPSGYITGLNTGNFITSSQTGLFYSVTNPSGFITGINSGTFVTGIVIRPSDTGQFYSNNNPSGYITLLNLNGLITSGNADIRYIQPSQTGFLASQAWVSGQSYATSNNLILSGSGLLNLINNLSGYDSLTYYLKSNPSGYLTGIDTGVYATINWSNNNYYPISNPSGFLTSVSISGGGLTTGTADLRYLQLGQTGQFYPNSNPSGFITNVALTNYIQNSQTGNFVTTGQTGNFASFSNLSATGLNLQSQITNLSGYVTGLNTGNFITQSQTGQFYPITNPSGYINNSALSSYATAVNLATTGSTLQTQISNLSGYGAGAYYLKSNPSGYITGLNTGNFITQNQTGQFYSSNNPSGYITGLNTGNFITSYQTGQFYPNSNPSGFITGVNTSVFVLRSETGLFYPVSNPSGFTSSIQTQGSGISASFAIAMSIALG